ncbi:hypothetical protein [Aliikangiella sp. IMCC44359]|uniref:hypothetical protein n=1 Tax=Aliikangiella sp. IMCC44359 TaxID=3459125 RepID=UPI00403B097A
MLPKLLNKLAKKYEKYRKSIWIVFLFSLSGLIATSVLASGPSSIVTIAQILMAGALAQSFFILGLLYGFRNLHSELTIMPHWKLGYSITEWVNAIIVSFLLPLPVVGLPIVLVMFILEKS